MPDRWAATNQRQDDLPADSVSAIGLSHPDGGDHRRVGSYELEPDDIEERESDARDGLSSRGT
jgi:hypothetical protein